MDCFFNYYYYCFFFSVLLFVIITRGRLQWRATCWFVLRVSFSGVTNLDLRKTRAYVFLCFAAVDEITRRVCQGNDSLIFLRILLGRNSYWAEIANPKENIIKKKCMVIEKYAQYTTIT